MAQKTVVSLIDDLDGKTAEESVTFGLDGVSYEIDLSKKNAGKLREALAPFVGSGRRVGGRAGRRAGRPAAAASRRAGGSDKTGEIRDWARGHGYTVSDRGRIAANVVAAYEKAH